MAALLMHPGRNLSQTKNHFMKKLIPVLLFLITVAACSNEADSDKRADTANLDVNTNTDIGDTSSYNRMPDKIVDSVPGQ
jgi:hypothetical protein